MAFNILVLEKRGSQKRKDIIFTPNIPILLNTECEYILKTILVFIFCTANIISELTGNSSFLSLCQIYVIS